MTAAVLTLTDFLLARIAEDEGEIEIARISDEPEWWMPSFWNRERAVAECEAKRRIVEFHKAWLVQVEAPPEFTQGSGDDLNSMTFHMSKRIAWITEQEFRNRFGTEPPTAPMLRALATIYADHPDYREDWRA